MAENSNGNVKWYQLTIACVSLLGIMITIAIWGINSVAANDRVREKADTEIRCMILDYIIPMKEDISAIKIRLGLSGTQRNY